MQNMSFVGLVDEAHALIQHQTRLYLVDYQRLRYLDLSLLFAHDLSATSLDFFYQIGLAHFANFGTIALEEAMDMKDLLRIGLEQESALHASPQAQSVEDLCEVHFLFKMGQQT